MSEDWALSALEKFGDEVSSIVEQLHTTYRRLDSDEDLTAEARTRRRSDARDKASAKLRELHVDARARAERLERSLGRKVDRVIGPLPGAEHQAAWERARRLLEAGRAPAEAVTILADHGDVAALRALRQELPVWLESDPAWREKSKPRGQRVSRTAVEDLLDAVELALAPHLAKEDRVIVGRRVKLRALRDAIESHAEFGRQSLAGPSLASSTARMASAHAANSVSNVAKRMATKRSA